VQRLSYECQVIQTKNPFDEILGLGFDLRHLKVTLEKILSIPIICLWLMYN
jgi:hypothetical protein